MAPTIICHACVSHNDRNIIETDCGRECMGIQDRGSFHNKRSSGVIIVGSLNKSTSGCKTDLDSDGETHKQIKTYAE
jgi:hypothetical protein